MQIRDVTTTVRSRSDLDHSFDFFTECRELGIQIDKNTDRLECRNRDE
jgi:hypothetical protein